MEELRRQIFDEYMRATASDTKRSSPLADSLRDEIAALKMENIALMEQNAKLQRENTDFKALLGSSCAADSCAVDPREEVRAGDLGNCATSAGDLDTFACADAAHVVPRSQVVDSTNAKLEFGRGSITSAKFLSIVHKSLHGCIPPRSAECKSVLVSTYVLDICLVYPSVKINGKKIMNVCIK